jgi:hypothetical protein
MLIPLYWILGYLGCALFTMLICPPIVWMLDSHLKSGTYKEMWDYAYKGDENPHPALIFLLWPIFIFFLFAFFIIDLPTLVKYIFGRKKRYIASVNEKVALIMKE